MLLQIHQGHTEQFVRNMSTLHDVKRLQVTAIQYMDVTFLKVNTAHK